MKTMIGVTLSLSISACLLSGIPSLSAFAFYLSVAVNVLAWLALFVGAVEKGAAANIRKNVWISAPSSLISVGALIYTGHPMLAASSVLVKVFILSAAFKKPPVAA